MEAEPGLASKTRNVPSSRNRSSVGSNGLTSYWDLFV